MLQGVLDRIMDNFKRPASVWVCCGLYHAVGTREDQPFTAIVESHQVRRLAVGSSHLDHLARAVWPVDSTTMYAQPVTDCRSHMDHLTGRLLPCHQL